MSGIATAVVAGAVISGAMSSKAQKDAANTASKAQTNAANTSIDESRRQFDKIQELLKPYTDVGPKSIGIQQDILGMNGNVKQAAAYSDVKNSDYYKTMAAQGEDAILQNASATGGLRGGNTQAALSQFRPSLLNSLIQQKYGNLAGMTAIGQNAAAGTGNAGMQTTQAINDQYGQIGAAQAGKALAGGQATSDMWSGIGSAIGYGAGRGMFGIKAPSSGMNPQTGAPAYTNYAAMNTNPYG